MGLWFTYSSDAASARSFCIVYGYRKLRHVNALVKKGLSDVEVLRLKQKIGGA